jgi:hypothetical protein
LGSLARDDAASIEMGRISGSRVELAGNFVKAGSVKGEAKMEMHKILPSIDKEATDEVDEQRISRQDRDAVRGYFDTLEKDTEK